MAQVLDRGNPRVVIVGAGFGGLKAARQLRHAPVQVTVVDRENHHLFQPLLYQVATAGLSPADISAPIRGVLRPQRNTAVMLADVTSIDVAGRAVLAGERRIPYDYLVVATGARHSYFAHPEWERAAPGLKSIADATSIRRRVLLAFEQAELSDDPAERASLLTFVIVGAGPTGVEMAGAIAEMAHKALVADFRHIDTRTARIVLAEAGPRILPSFSEKLATRAQHTLERMGVRVLAGHAVEQVDAAGVVVAGQRIAARTVIWAAGVTASPAGEWLGATVDRAGRVVVEPDLTVPEHPEIYVIGDTANVTNVTTGGHPLPGVASVAMQQGRYVARQIARRVRGQAHGHPFTYVDKGSLATIGRAYAIAAIWHIEMSGYLAWLTWMAVHIFYLIGFQNRLLVMVQWAWVYLTHQRRARLIVPSESSRQPLRQPAFEARPATTGAKHNAAASLRTTAEAPAGSTSD